MNLLKRFQYDGSEKLSLKDWKTDDKVDFYDKNDSVEEIQKDIEKLRVMQSMLYAQDKHSVLIVFQAIDAAGKDSTISHVMSGINPQGCTVTSFKTPSDEELGHDFLWRINNHLPERGQIGIFNRSYYEEVLVTKVHPEFILGEKIPGVDSLDTVSENFWQKRYSDIRNYEKYLSRNGYTIIKFFLHLSKEEQRKRFLQRIEQKDKNWKFSEADMKERELWNDYQKAFEDAINHTATKRNPWYIIPADSKWFMRLAVSKIINERMSMLDLAYPEISKEKSEELNKIKDLLLNENNNITIKNEK